MKKIFLMLMAVGTMKKAELQVLSSIQLLKLPKLRLLSCLC